MTHYSFRGLPDIHRIVRENPDARAIYVAGEHDSILLVRCNPGAEKEAEQVCQRVLQQHGGGEVGKLVTVRLPVQDGRPTVAFAVSYCGSVHDFLPDGWLVVHGQIDRHDHPAIRQLITEVRQIPAKPRVTVVAYAEVDDARSHV